MRITYKPDTVRVYSGGQLVATLDSMVATYRFDASDLLPDTDLRGGFDIHPTSSDPRKNTPSALRTRAFVADRNDWRKNRKRK